MKNPRILAPYGHGNARSVRLNFQVILRGIEAR